MDIFDQLGLFDDVADNLFDGLDDEAEQEGLDPAVLGDFFQDVNYGDMPGDGVNPNYFDPEDEEDWGDFGAEYEPRDDEVDNFEFDYFNPRAAGRFYQAHSENVWFPLVGLAITTQEFRHENQRLPLQQREILTFDLPPGFALPPQVRVRVQVIESRGNDNQRIHDLPGQLLNFYVPAAFRPPEQFIVQDPMKTYRVAYEFRTQGYHNQFFFLQQYHLYLLFVAASTRNSLNRTPSYQYEGADQGNPRVYPFSMNTQRQVLIPQPFGIYITYRGGNENSRTCPMTYAFEDETNAFPGFVNWVMQRLQMNQSNPFANVGNRFILECTIVVRYSPEFCVTALQPELAVERDRFMAAVIGLGDRFEIVDRNDPPFYDLGEFWNDFFYNQDEEQEDDEEDDDRNGHRNPFDDDEDGFQEWLADGAPAGEGVGQGEAQADDFPLDNQQQNNAAGGPAGNPAARGAPPPRGPRRRGDPVLRDLPPRGPDTRGRRAEANLPPAANTRGARAARGIQFVGYRTKAKMFQKTSIESIFQHSDALAMDFPGGDHFCFLRAFLQAEHRIVYEKAACADDFQYFPPKCQFARDFLRECRPECGAAVLGIQSNEWVDSEFYDTRSGFVVLGNSYKHHPRADQLEVYKAQLRLAALSVLGYVTAVEGQLINFNDFITVTTIFSRVFKTVIHVFDRMHYCQRRQSVCAFDTSKEPFVRHVAILMDGCHSFAITNIRTLLRKEMVQQGHSLHNYCDYCSKLNYSNQTREEAFVHMQKCSQRKKGNRFRNASFDSFLLKCFGVEGNGSGKERFRWDKVKKAFRCMGCQSFLGREECIVHRCYITPVAIPDAYPDEKIYVFDIESSQTRTVSGLLKHTCILLCVQNVYNQQVRKSYLTSDAFMEDLLADARYDDSCFLAHNGGGYDFQFLLVYCEENIVPHKLIPNPTSAHKFFSLEIEAPNGKWRRFIDFMAMVPGSLKSVGQNFGLTVTKGDFPHRFQDVEYNGRIPALDSPDDFFCLKQLKDRTAEMELRTWYAEQVQVYCTCVETGTRCPLPSCGLCGKRNWNYRVELERYCWLDVEVLAQCAKIYRNKIRNPAAAESIDGWSFLPGVDPFSFLTASQIGLAVFLRGFDIFPKLRSIQFNERPDQSWKAVFWMWEEKKDKPTVVSRCTQLLEPFLPEVHLFVDGYDTANGNVYLFGDKVGAIKEKLIAQGIPVVHLTERLFDEKLQETYDYEQMQLAFEPIRDREFFFGGRTEVFAPYAKIDDVVHELKYLDVCSLYPYICANRSFPIGEPQLLFHTDIEYERLMPGHPDPYFGFVKCLVSCNRSDMIGLLPCRDPETGRLEFHLEDKVGTWHTCELAFAISKGYTIQRIYQVLHWVREERSDDFFRGYVSYFLRMKQEADGWKKAGAQSESPSRGEQNLLVDLLYEKNGRLGRMRIPQVAVNKTDRSIAKAFLNSLWGKLCQRSQKDYYATLNGYQQFLEFSENALVDKGEVWYREFHEGFVKVRYRRKKGCGGNTYRYNIFVAASVTAYARTYLHQKMFALGPERILYCDTDSVIFIWRIGEPCGIDIGLGNWTDEHPEERIVKFIGMAPKSYLLEFAARERFIKTKGVRMTLENQEKATTNRIEDILLQEISTVYTTQDTIQLQHMTIFPNSLYTALPYATMLTRYTEKILRFVLTKRHLTKSTVASLEGLVRVSTVPHGFM